MKITVKDRIGNLHGMNYFLRICLRFVLYVPPRIELKLMYIDDANQGLKLIQRLILARTQSGALCENEIYLRLTKYLFNRMWAVSAQWAACWRRG